MKARTFLVTIGAAALAAITLPANASDVRLTPRAAGNQIKHVAGPANDPNLLNTTGIFVVSPRARGNQAKAVAGTNSGATPAMACVRQNHGRQPEDCSGLC